MKALALVSGQPQQASLSFCLSVSLSLSVSLCLSLCLSLYLSLSLSLSVSQVNLSGPTGMSFQWKG